MQNTYFAKIYDRNITKSIYQLLKSDGTAAWPDRTIKLMHSHQTL